MDQESRIELVHRKSGYSLFRTHYSIMDFLKLTAGISSLSREPGGVEADVNLDELQQVTGTVQ